MKVERVYSKRTRHNQLLKIFKVDPLAPQFSKKPIAKGTESRMRWKQSWMEWSSISGMKSGAFDD
jgi:hypothetical protein